MDFDKTSFSVDWFTPGDKYGPKRLSFPKSACISIDDLVSDSPLSFCFTPVDEALPKPYTHPIVDTPYERACGRTNSAPPSPLVPFPREPYHMYGQDPKSTSQSPMGWQALASPGVLSIVDDCAACGVEVDVACLGNLDEQLLLSPVECFIELCWSAAVRDDMTSPVVHRNSRFRACSFKGEGQRCPPPAVRDYPVSFEQTRPLAAKILLPLNTNLHLPSTSPSSDSHDTSHTYPENPPAYILYADSQERPLAAPAAHDMPWHSKKRELTLAPPVDRFKQSHAQPPPTPRLKTPRSSHALRVVSEACATLARVGKRSPLAAP